MSGNGPKHELPKHIEHYLAALSRLYAQKGKKQLQSIIVNSNIRVHEEWDCDGWNGGQFGHALYLIIPEPLFLSVINDKDEIREEIKNGINNLHNVRNEYISVVFLEMEIVEDQDWRKESGVLLSGQRMIAPEAESRGMGS